MDHTFVIPIYRSAPALPALLRSLQEQTVRSSILLASSTPSPELKEFANRSGLALHIHPQRVDIATDWNFALSVAQTRFVTLAHQDDLFAPTYVARLQAALRRNSGALLAFCDYSEHTPLGERPANVNLRIKRILRERAFRGRECIRQTADKLRLLSLGNPICCPSVMLDREVLPDFRFPAGFQSNLDWMAWLELARRPGGFVYVRDSLVSKGVHPASETTVTIGNRARLQEDRALFGVLWPAPIAAVLAAVYRMSYVANRIRTSPPPG